MEEILNFEVFIKYKKAIKENKERYKLALLKALEEDKLEEDKFIFLIYKEIIGIWENDWKEEPNVYVDKLKFHNWIFQEYKEEIGNDKERYKPVLLKLLEEDKIDFNIFKGIIDIWEKEWKEEVNIYIDNLKFKNRNLFQEYKEEIGKNKERYKPVLLELLKEDKIDFNIFKGIIDIWEKEWKEESSIEIDKLKFSYYTFQEYREEIKNDKEKYKPILLELLEKNRIYQFIIYKGIIDIWEEEWKEESNEYINKLKIEIDKLKFEDKDIFKEYKEEIVNDKEKYKPILLELLEQYKINKDIHEEIIEIWEKKWKEESNEYINKLKIEMDKVKFGYYTFEEYKEEIIKDKERYKPILLELLEENKIEYYLGEIVDIWEKEWKEEENIEIDKVKFEDNDIFEEYKEEIIKDKERYKPALLKAVEENIKGMLGDLYLCPSVLKLWECEWKEEPNLEVDKLIFGGWYFDKDYEDYLNFDENDELDYEDEDDYYQYEQALITKELIENPKRYKPVLLKLLETNIEDIRKDLFLCHSVVTLWEEEWKEEANIYIDKLKFYNEDAFLDFEDKIIANPERYKPVLIDLILNEDYFFYNLYKHILDEWGELEI